MINPTENLEAPIKAILKTYDNANIELNSSCLIPISVGQDYHESKKFIGTISKINSVFSECTFVICDTLQRYSIQIINEVGDSELAKSMSIEHGDEWLSRNKKSLMKVTIPHEITFWEDWKKQNVYPGYEKKINDMYTNDMEFKSIVNNTADSFLIRRCTSNKNIITNYSYYFNLCVSYLLEESAVRAMWGNMGFDYHLYPAKENQAMTYLDNKIIRKHNPTKLKPLKIKFKKVQVMDMVCE